MHHPNQTQEEVDGDGLDVDDGDGDDLDGGVGVGGSRCLEHLFGRIRAEDVDISVSPDDLRKAASSFSWRTSFGTDAIHPRQVALQSDGLLWLLVGIILGIAIPCVFTGVRGRP